MYPRNPVVPVGQDLESAGQRHVDYQALQSQKKDSMEMAVFFHKMRLNTLKRSLVNGAV